VVDTDPPCEGLTRAMGLKTMDRGTDDLHRCLRKGALSNGPRARNSAKKMTWNPPHWFAETRGD
jgi:hypothetical protein